METRKLSSIVTMGFQYRLLCLIPTILFLFGCSTSPNINILDENFVKDVDSDSRISLVGYKAKHLGSSGAQVGGTICLGPFGALATTMHEQRENPKITPNHGKEQKEQQYERRLDKQCLKAIESVLHANAYFEYVYFDELNPVERNPDEADEIRELCKINSLGGVIEAYVTYGMTSGWQKPLSLTVNWTIFDPEGNRSLECQTICISKEGYALFPDTRNPEYENAYIELARKNAEAFLSMLGKTWCSSNK